MTSLVFFLIQLFGLQLMASARPSCQLPGHIVTTCHHLLHSLGPSFHSQCRHYNHIIALNVSVVLTASADQDQCHLVSRVLYELLRGAEEIFEVYDLPGGEDGGSLWDQNKLDEFQNLQDQLVQLGSNCLRPGQTDDVASSGILSSYFVNVTSVLQQQDSASCGWMALKRDMVEVLRSAVSDHKACFSWRNAS